MPEALYRKKKGRRPDLSTYLRQKRERTRYVGMDSMFLVEVPGHLEDALVEGLEVLEEAGREVCGAGLEK